MFHVRPCSERLERQPLRDRLTVAIALIAARLSTSTSWVWDRRHDQHSGGADEEHVHSVPRRCDAVTGLGEPANYDQLLPVVATALGKERQSGQQVLAGGALTAGIFTARSTWTTGGVVIGQRVEPSEQLAHQGELLDALRKLSADSPLAPGARGSRRRPRHRPSVERVGRLVRPTGPCHGGRCGRRRSCARSAWWP